MFSGHPVKVFILLFEILEVRVCIKVGKYQGNFFLGVILIILGVDFLANLLSLTDGVWLLS